MQKYAHAEWGNRPAEKAATEIVATETKQTHIQTAQHAKKKDAPCNATNPGRWPKWGG